MKLALTIPVAAALCCMVGAVAAQDAPTAVGSQRVVASRAANGLEVAILRRQLAYRDRGASPLIYSGYGWTTTLGYARRSPRTRTDIAALGSWAALSPRADFEATALNFDGGVAASYLRQLSRAAPSWFAGPTVRLRANARVHRYPDPNRTEELFGHGIASFGVSLRSEHQTRRMGLWSQEASVPVWHFGFWPYGTAKSVVSGALRPRWLHAGKLRGVEETISFQRAKRGRAAIRWTYQFSYLHADDAVSRRFAQHAFGGVLNLQLGGVQ